MIDLEKLLNKDQKESVVNAQLAQHGVTGPYTLKYDTKFSWDFAVRKAENAEGEIIPRVVLSVSIAHRRFPTVIAEVARAIEEVREGKRTNIHRGSGPFAERNML